MFIFNLLNLWSFDFVNDDGNIFYVPSDDEIQIVITTTELIRINNPVNLVNYHFSGINQ